MLQPWKIGQLEIYGGIFPLNSLEKFPKKLHWCASPVFQEHVAL